METTANSDAQVILHNTGELKITNLVITNTQVIELIRQQILEGAEPAELVVNLIEIGAKAASIFNANAGAETIKNALEKTQEDISKSSKEISVLVESQIKKVNDKDGEFQKGLALLIEKLSADLEEAVSGEDTPLREALRKSLNALNEKVIKDVKENLSEQKQNIALLLDPEQPTSPLRSIRGQLEQVAKTLEEMQREINSKAVAKAIEGNAPIGGVNYEDDVVAVLKSIALEHSDLCEQTGNTTGYVRNSKRGDAVVEFHTGTGQKARIVAEAKDRVLNSSEWLAEAKEGRRNRRAEGFIGLCKSPQLMPNEGQRVWIHDMKTVVLAFDPENDDSHLLKIIYQFVKITTMTGSASLDEDATEIVLHHLKNGVGIIEKFDESERHVSSIKTATKKLEESLNGIRENLETELKAAQRALMPVSNSDDEPLDIGSEEDMD